MKRPIVIVCLTLLQLLFFASSAQAFQNRALILYDTADKNVIHLAHDNTLASLMGHFNLPYTRKPVSQYSKGDINNYRVTFYIGNTIGHKLPTVFLREALNSSRPIVWINFNLAQLARSSKYQRKFEERFGFRYKNTLINNSYENVFFRERTFKRQNEIIGKTKILDDSRAKVMGLAITPNRRKLFPYIVRSGTFYYVADNPMDVWREDQSYIVFADVLHTMVGIAHSTNHRALIRLENVDAETRLADVTEATDYLKSRNVPFSIAAIPRFTDPLGVSGPPRTIDLDKSPTAIAALNYMVAGGGTVVMHGFTHQYDAFPNPYDAMSGNDAEFYTSRFVNGNIKMLGPTNSDSRSWVQHRINKGKDILEAAGFGRPSIWVTPNYIASSLDYQIFGERFTAENGRSPDAYFPYIINKDLYGTKVIPENLGSIVPDQVSARQIVNRAKLNLVVRDGFASFFFHARLDHGAEYNGVNLRIIVEGIQRSGFRFVDIKTL